MKEILSGLYHWTTFHEGIGQRVHSYFWAGSDPPVLIDPRVPEEGIDWFRGSASPGEIYLTNRHHYRHSGQFEKAFGATVRCHREGLIEFTRGEKIVPFEHGDELPGGVQALRVGVLCLEETALHLPIEGGVLAIGDAVIRSGDSLAFVPDELMGNDPEGVKKGLKEVFLRIADEREFDHLLFAHGAPWIGGGKEELRRFFADLAGDFD